MEKRSFSKSVVIPRLCNSCRIISRSAVRLNMDGTLHETPPGEQLRFLNGEPVPPETE